MVLAKQDLPLYKPLDLMQWRLSEYPVLVWKQSLTAADGKVTARYLKDQSPAVIEKTHGKGKAVLFGFFPGMAYEKSGLPILPADRGGTTPASTTSCRPRWTVVFRQHFVERMLPKDFTRPVECSEPLVRDDLHRLEGKARRTAHQLHRQDDRQPDRPHQRLEAAPSSIRSIERGALKSETKDGATIVTLRLDVADMLLIDR